MSGYTVGLGYKKIGDIRIENITNIWLDKGADIIVVNVKAPNGILTYHFGPKAANIKELVEAAQAYSIALLNDKLQIFQDIWARLEA